jgi:hypothetical protein
MRTKEKASPAGVRSLMILMIAILTARCQLINLGSKEGKFMSSNMKKYQGSCDCGKITFTASIDLSAGTGRCNCNFCTKNRYWGAIIKPEEFNLVSGQEWLSDYTEGAPLTFKPGEVIAPYAGHHLFCKLCGTHAFGKGNLPEIGGEYVSINVACLDDVNFKEAMSSPIRYFDGRNNNWFSVPEYTAHL